MMSYLVNLRSHKRSPKIRVKNSAGTPVTLSPSTDVTVDLDDLDVQKQLGHHSAVGQWFVSSSVAGGSGTSLLVDRRRRQANALRDQPITFDRYVDFANGVDTNDGLTIATAWKTLAKVATAGAANAGLNWRVGLRRGSFFMEAFTVPADGMLFGAYGPTYLPRPIVAGGYEYTHASAWTQHSGNIYKRTAVSTLGTGLYGWIDNGTFLTNAGSVGAMTAGSYFADAAGTTLYVWTPEGTSPNGRAIAVVNNATTIFTNGKANTVVQDIAVKYGSSNNNFFWFNATAQPGGAIKRCEVGPHGGTGIIWGAVGGLIEDSDIHHCWRGTYYPGAQEYGISLTTGTDGSEVRYNRIAYNGRGIAGNNAWRSPLVHHNRVLRQHVNGIDMITGTAGFPPVIFNNFVWHRPTGPTPAGHGIDSQTAAVGGVVLNNIVYCDFVGTATNVQLYCQSGTLTSGRHDYNLGFRAPGCTSDYGKVNSTVYPTLAAFAAALVVQSIVGAEAHGIEADPMVTDLAGEDWTLRPDSPAVNAGVALDYPSEMYLGAAPDLGVYEMA